MGVAFCRTQDDSWTILSSQESFSHEGFHIKSSIIPCYQLSSKVQAPGRWDEILHKDGYSSILTPDTCAYHISTIVQK